MKIKQPLEASCQAHFIGFPFFLPFLCIPQAALAAQHFPEHWGNLWGKAWRTAAQHTHAQPSAFIPPLLKGKGRQGSGEICATGSREEQHRGHPQGKATACADSRSSLPCRSPEQGVSLPPYCKAEQNPRMQDPAAGLGAGLSSQH